MRIAMILLLLVLPARAARAERVEVDGFMGFELGPSVSTTGALGELAQTGFGGNFRMGLRANRVGVEVHLGGRGAELARSDTMPTLSGTSMYFMRSGLSYYALLLGPLQMLGHAELGFGGIGGTHTKTVACPLEDECPGGVRSETESISYNGFGMHLGVTLQVHLGRRGKQHAMLWATAGTTLLRFRFAEDVASGRSTGYAFGVAFAM